MQPMMQPVMQQPVIASPPVQQTVVVSQQIKSGPINVTVVESKCTLVGNYVVDLRIKNSTHFVRTNKIKGSNHVTYNQIFQLQCDHLAHDCLVAKLYDHSSLHNHLLGMIEIPLGPALSGVPVDQWYELYEDVNKHKLRGSIHLVIQLAVPQPSVMMPPQQQQPYFAPPQAQMMPPQGQMMAPQGQMMPPQGQMMPPQGQMMAPQPPPGYYPGPMAPNNAPPYMMPPLQQQNSQGQLQHQGSQSQLQQQPQNTIPNLPPYGAPTDYSPMYPQLYPVVPPGYQPSAPQQQQQQQQPSAPQPSAPQQQ